MASFVNLKSVRLTERLLAVFAGVRPFSRVYFDVLFEVAKLDERFGTLGTRIGSDSFVASSVLV